LLKKNNALRRCFLILKDEEV